MDGLAGFDRVSAEERVQLTALCTEYCWRADNYHAADIPELFADDATWEVPGTVMRGKQQLVAGWRIRAQGGKQDVRRHLLSNLRFFRDPDNVMRGCVTFSLFHRPIGENAAPVLQLVGEWIDSYTRVPGGNWLFKTREVRFLFPMDWSAAPAAPDAASA
jgi:hypothetical protein